MGNKIIGDIKSGTAMCHDCMTKNGFSRSDRGSHTAVLALCIGCDNAKPLLSSRHWIKQ